MLRQNDDYDGKQLVDNLVVASTFAEAQSGGATGNVKGDYNGNNVVDAADYVVWREAQSTGATTLDNRDPLQAGNLVGPLDYDYWRARFGNMLGGPASASAAMIPEPASVALLTAAILLGVITRRSAFRGGRPNQSNRTH